MMSKPTLRVHVWEKSLCGQTARSAAQRKLKTSAAVSPRELAATMTVESAEPVNLFLFCFSDHHTPKLKISHQKELSHGYYRMGGHEISTSRSLDMIGKLSLVMWLHFNHSYSKLWTQVSKMSQFALNKRIVK